jgi:hypothetical protein
LWSTTNSTLNTLFHQQFRRDIRSGRFIMEFAPSALERAKTIADPLLILLLGLTR